jgi:hypothetical protein
MTAARDVVELIAEVAVANVLAPEREGELQDELDRSEEQREPNGCSQISVRWPDGG